MSHKGFKAKVEQLEHLRVEFDDAKSIDENEGGPMPQQISSKQKYNNKFQNNNKYTFKRKQ